MSKKIYVGMLDDHPAIIAGYQAQIIKSSKLKTAWTARYYSEVETNLQKHPTDILILDASVDNGPDDPNPFPILHDIPKLLDEYPDMSILVISMHDRRAFIRAIQQTGASGYILKDDVEANENLEKILIAISEGEIYYSPRAEKLINQYIKEEPMLTHRQIEILSLYASKPNLTTKELAKELGLAHSTTRNHLSEIYMRLGVRKMASAIIKARQYGIITPEQ
jgi:DNA-binding NarL/FixJ family response regulator